MLGLCWKERETSVTLPEITIVGDPGSVPVSIADWFAEGFSKGWLDPGAKPEAPAPLNEEALASFFEGVHSGSLARRGIEAMIENDQGQGIEPDIGGKIFEEVEREYREMLAKALETEHGDNPGDKAPGNRVRAVRATSPRCLQEATVDWWHGDVKKMLSNSGRNDRA